jgi:S1-C subfamily serine protease
VLTNTHVAEAFATYDGKWLIINEKIGVRSARIVSMAKHHTPINIDAAVMQVDDFKNDTWLTFNTKSALDDQIFIAGYPGDATLLDQRYAILTNALQSGRLPDTSRLPTAVVNEGRINNFIEDSSSKAVDLQYTMVTGPGNSGSPIVNACGQIVGLHYHGGARGADIKFNGAVHAKNVRVYLEYYVGVQADFSQEHCR